MSTLQHPHAELSAYVDGALPTAERAAVEAHLGDCAVCRTHVAELRATASLIGALPDPVPSRRLVPRLAQPAWLAPLRTLSSIASGVSAFVFVASVLLSSLGAVSSGGATTALEPLRQAAPAAAPAPEKAATTAAPSPAGFGAAQPQQATPPTTQRSTSAADARQETASPSAVAAAPATGPESARAQSANEARPSAPNPWIWLALALITGAFAIALQRRIHSRG